MSDFIQCCTVCGGSSFSSKNILWENLIQEWGLSEHEARYIDRQQGTHCDQCGCNLRSLALAKAILSSAGCDSTFKRFLGSPRTWLKRVLEINEAGTLSAYLKRLPRGTLATYPEIDMQRLPYADASFDLVLHSDTLEHVPDPLMGLRECQRVLRPGGWCCFTVPIITGRLSRTRQGLPPSHHGRSTTDQADMLVQTEYGSDFWEPILQAGFDECRLVTVEYPAAQAIAARKPLS